MIRPTYRALFFSFLVVGGCSNDPSMGDYDAPLIGGYCLTRESPDSVEILHTNDSRHLGVPAKVISIAWNRRFIIAKQQELKNRGDFPGDTFQVPVSGKFNYWLIDTVQTNRSGPMSENEFITKVKQLGLFDLKLKDVGEVVRQR